MRAKFVNNILRGVIPYDVATKTRDKPLTAKQIREIFTRHVKDLDNNVLGWNELKAAFSELGASYPDFRADRALVFADPNGDGLIASDYEMDELVCYAWLVFWQPDHKSDEETGMFLSDEQLRVVFKEFEDKNVLSKKNLKKAFNHLGLFFPEHADKVLDQSDKDGFFELKQLDDLAKFAVQYGLLLSKKKKKMKMDSFFSFLFFYDRVYS
jgi:hypothetical protein